MTKRITLALGLVTGMALTHVSTAQAEDIVVVVNGSAPVERLTDREIKDIYLGEKAFWGKVKIIPVSYRSRASLQNEFLRKVVKIAPDNFKKYWIKVREWHGRLYAEFPTERIPQRLCSMATAMMMNHWMKESG